MHVSDYDYELPEDRIALTPPTIRGQSRLLVVDRQTGEIEHKAYSDLINYLEPGDLVVLNNTKVIKARLVARNVMGQARELLLIEEHGTPSLHTRKALYRRKIHEGELLRIGDVEIEVIKLLGGGLCEVHSTINLLDLAEQAGNVPLPPYIKRQATTEDRARYQTVFAQAAGSVAAPTASLNFTKELEAKLLAKGVKIAYLTLHVGLGTFLPMRTDDVEKHVMHSEYFEISAKTVKAIQAAKKAGRQVCAAGTTVARTLEFVAKQLDEPAQYLNGEVDIFMYPGYRFQVVDMLLTNFHAPRTTVLMLAAAFAGWEHLQKAYQTALTENYKFLSYGDSMLIR
jgi:S-adenosylmethionine:tRNA ribosyltransferase-isomerase